jgi:hypothetical protein
VTSELTSASALITLHGDEAADLAWLLGEVEDWLLHTDALVLHDLDHFLGPVVLGATRAAEVVARLGHYSSLISRRRRGEPA